MVEVVIANGYLELKNGESIKYTFQVNDIFDLSTVNSSYSNAFEIEKTPANTKTLQGLGLVGSASEIPYSKTESRILFHGFDVISYGWLSVVSTTDKYKISISNGIIDFFKEIENKNIGTELDLTEINHRKTLNTVVDSFTNPYYRYNIADYGGKTNIQLLAGSSINIDYLAPSAKVKYLWDKIFEKFKWTYSGSIKTNPDFTDLYITYPLAPESEGDEPVDPILIAEVGKFAFQEVGFTVVNGEKQFTKNKTWSYQIVDEGFIIDNWTYQFNSNGNFRVEVNPTGYIRYRMRQPAPANGWSYRNFPITFRVRRGTQVYEIDTTATGPEAQLIINDLFFTGETITFEIVAKDIAETSIGKYEPDKLFFNDTTVKVYKTSLGTVDFNKAFLDFSIKDFIKEQVIAFGLTPIVDADERNIHFLSVDERINADKIDWSENYFRRTEEKYAINSYAQKNGIRHKYNTDNSEFNDGFLYVNNANLPDVKTIFQSKIYSPLNEASTINTLSSSYITPIFPIWQSEAKEVENDEGETVIEIEYKGLNGRFYYQKSENKISAVNFTSIFLGGSRTEASFPISNTIMTLFKEKVQKYWSGYETLLNYSKIHDIDLAIGLADILALDFYKVYHFEQEASDYILNKLVWEDGKVISGEFIKINR